MSVTVVATGVMLSQAVDNVTAHNCTCRAHSRDFAQGQMTCINGKLARCTMVLNNSSWQFTKDSCVISGRLTQLALLKPKTPVTACQH